MNNLPTKCCSEDVATRGGRVWGRRATLELRGNWGAGTARGGAEISWGNDNWMAGEKGLGRGGRRGWGAILLGEGRVWCLGLGGEMWWRIWKWLQDLGKMWSEGLWRGAELCTLKGAGLCTLKGAGLCTWTLLFGSWSSSALFPTERLHKKKSKYEKS